MSEIPDWPGYDESKYELRNGIPVPFSRSDRLFREGYLDYVKATQLGGSIGHRALWACLYDDIHHVYMQQAHVLDPGRPGGLTADHPFTGHRLPIDIRHVTETRVDEQGQEHRLKRVEYLRRRLGELSAEAAKSDTEVTDREKADVLFDLINPHKWAVGIVSIREHHQQLLYPPKGEFAVGEFGEAENSFLESVVLYSPVANAPAAESHGLIIDPALPDRLAA